MNSCCNLCVPNDLDSELNTQCQTCCTVYTLKDLRWVRRRWMRLKGKEDEKDQEFNGSAVRLQLEGNEERGGTRPAALLLSLPIVLLSSHIWSVLDIKALRFHSSLRRRVLFKQTIPEASKAEERSSSFCSCGAFIRQNQHLLQEVTRSGFQCQNHPWHFLF